MRGAIAAGAVFIAYVAIAAIPAETLWFDPQTPVFADAAEGTAPAMVYSRTIYRGTYISYAVVVRNVETGAVVCDARAGPYEYKPVRGPVVGETLLWWAPSDPRCTRLRQGAYWVETTWRIERPLGDLAPSLDWLIGWMLPPKVIRRQSPPFTIFDAGEAP